MSSSGKIRLDNPLAKHTNGIVAGECESLVQRWFQ